MSALVLGLDLGSASSKAVLARADGTVVATAERPHALSFPQTGWVEHDAEGVWWGDAVALCRELLPQADGPVVAVCPSGIGPCVLPTDADFTPLRPAILYGIDTRATGECDELTELLGEDAVHERGGSVLTSQAAGAKLAWLRRHEPDTWSRTERFLSASSYLVAKLTGEYVLDRHTASQYNPLYDLHGDRWHEPWADLVAPGLPLPRLEEPGAVAGTVTRGAAAATGIPAGTPVLAGTVDAWAEAVSCGVEQAGDCMLMYGTTMFLVQVLDALVTDRRLWATRGVQPGSVTLAGGMASSGAVTDWLRQLTGEARFTALVHEAAQVPVGADALVVLPYFAGERTPLFDSDARGAVLGLTLRHRRAHLYRAVLEATGYAVRHHLEVMGECGAEPRRLVAVGGGTGGGLWTQIVADITQQPQELPRQTIGASYGDALLAARSAGLVEPGETWARTTTLVEPRPETAAVYDELYGVFRALYPATRQLAHVLAARQRTTGLVADASA